MSIIFIFYSSMAMICELHLPNIHFPNLTVTKLSPSSYRPSLIFPSDLPCQQTKLNKLSLHYRYVHAQTGYIHQFNLSPTILYFYKSKTRLKLKCSCHICTGPFQSSISSHDSDQLYLHVLASDECLSTLTTLPTNEMLQASLYSIIISIENVHTQSIS